MYLTNPAYVAIHGYKEFNQFKIENVSKEASLNVIYRQFTANSNELGKDIDWYRRPGPVPVKKFDSALKFTKLISHETNFSFSDRAIPA